MEHWPFRNYEISLSLMLCFEVRGIVFSLKWHSFWWCYHKQCNALAENIWVSAQTTLSNICDDVTVNNMFRRKTLVFFTKHGVVYSNFITCNVECVQTTPLTSKPCTECEWDFIILKSWIFHHSPWRWILQDTTVLINS